MSQREIKSVDVVFDIEGVMLDDERRMLPGTKELITQLELSHFLVALWTLADEQVIQKIHEFFPHLVNAPALHGGLREAIDQAKKLGFSPTKEVIGTIIRNQAKHPGLLNSNVLVENDPYFQTEGVQEGFICIHPDDVPNRSEDPSLWASSIRRLIQQAIKKTN